jgi:hypothetical protein
MVARKGENRHSRVAAAIAIRRLDPGLAKDVFLQEYGTFTVSHHPWLIVFGPWSNLRVSYYLRALGIGVPPEIVDVQEAKVLLTMHARQQLDSRQVAEAVNAYNQTLHDLLQAGRWEELADLGRGGNHIELLQQCLDAAGESEGAPKGDQGGIFGSDDDGDEDGIFGSD